MAIIMTNYSQKLQLRRTAKTLSAALNNSKYGGDSYD